MTDPTPERVPWTCPICGYGKHSNLMALPKTLIQCVQCRRVTRSDPITPERPWANCTGAGDCPEAWHTHGCYADKGQCSDPLDHLEQMEAFYQTEQSVALALAKRPEAALIYRGWITYPDGSRSDVERWVRAADGDWISLDSTRRTSGDIQLEQP